MDAGSSTGLAKLEKMQRAEIKKLEKWLIELGAEVYKMRQEIREMRDQHLQTLAAIGEMRVLMRNNGLVENTLPDLQDPINQEQESLDQQLEDYNLSLTHRKRLSH